MVHRLAYRRGSWFALRAMFAIAFGACSHAGTTATDKHDVGTDTTAAHDADAAASPPNPCDDGEPCTVETQLADGSCELGFALGAITMETMPAGADPPIALELHRFVMGPENILYTRWVSQKITGTSHQIVAGFDRHLHKVWQLESPCYYDYAELVKAGDGVVETCGLGGGPRGSAGNNEGVTISRYVNGKSVLSKFVGFVHVDFGHSYASKQTVGYANGDIVVAAMVGGNQNPRKPSDPETDACWLARIDAKGNLLWSKQVVFPQEIYSCFISRLGAGTMVWPHDSSSEKENDHGLIVDAQGETLSKPSIAQFLSVIDGRWDLPAPEVLEANFGVGGLALRRLTAPKFELPGQTVWQGAHYPNYPAGAIGGVWDSLGFWNVGVFFIHAFYATLNGTSADQFYAVYLDNNGEERFRKHLDTANWNPHDMTPKPFARNRLEMHPFGLIEKDLTPENAALHILDPWGHATCAEAGICASKTLEACLDLDPCTADDCDPKLGCTHVPLPDDATCNWSTGAKCKKGICK